MKKENVVFGLLLIAVFIVTFSTVFNSKLDINGDNAAYYSLAEGIAKGLGYVSPGDINMNPANHFPPGYPALISLFMCLGIKSVIFFKILNGLFLCGTALLLFWLTGKWTQNKVLAFVMSVLILMSVNLLQFSTMMMTEIPYLFFSVLAVWLLDKMSQKDDRCFWKNPYFYLLILMISAMYYFRSVGVSMLGAVIVYFLFRKEWYKAAGVAVGVVLTFIPWIIRNHIHGLTSRYFGTVMTVNPWRPEEGTISSVGEFIEKMIQNFEETVLRGFRDVLFPFLHIDYQVPAGAADWIYGLIIVAVIFWGCWQLERWRWLFMSYLLFNIGIFMLWHGGNGWRYVVPIIPFIYIGFYVGLFSILRLLVKQSAALQKLPYVFLLFGLLMIPSIKEEGEIAKQPYMPAYANYFQIAKALEKNAKGTIVSCRKPELFLHFAPSVYTCRYAFSLDDKQVIKSLVDAKADYVIVEQLGYSSTPRYLVPAINKNPGLFEPVIQMKDPDTYLFRFDRKKAEELLKGQ